MIVVHVGRGTAGTGTPHRDESRVKRFTSYTHYTRSRQTDIYIYIYIYICIYIYIYMYLFVYRERCKHIYIYIYTHDVRTISVQYRIYY